MIDTETRLSPGWWLKVLAGELHARRFSPQWSRLARVRRAQRPPLELLESYLRGDPPLPESAQGWEEELFEFVRQARMNYALMCVQSVQQRLRPLGFGTGGEDDRDGDSDAGDVYRANDLDLSLIHI